MVMASLDVSARPSYGTVDQAGQDDGERDQLLLVSEADMASSEADSTDGMQEGVRKIEAINLTWTARSLIIAYIRFVRSFGARTCLTKVVSS